MKVMMGRASLMTQAEHQAKGDSASKRGQCREFDEGAIQTTTNFYVCLDAGLDEKTI